MRPTGSSSSPRRLFAALLLTALLMPPQGLRAEDKPYVWPDLHAIKVVDVFNLFPNVGALIYVAEPNDFGSLPASSPPAPARSFTSASCWWRGIARRRRRRAPALHQGLRDVQPQCTGSLHVARGLGLRLPSLAADLSATRGMSR